MILEQSHWRDGLIYYDLLQFSQIVSVADTTPPPAPGEEYDDWGVFMTNANVTLPSDIVDYGLLKAMPTSQTDLATKTCAITQLVVLNPTAGAITFTITDKASSPLTVWNAKSVAAGGEYVFRSSEGAWFSGGMTVASSAPGLIYSLVLFQNTV